MNIYKVSRTDKIGWDQYDSFICYARDEIEARDIPPSSSIVWDADNCRWGEDYTANDSPEDRFASHAWPIRADSPLKVEFIGKGPSDVLPGVILASFIAG